MTKQINVLTTVKLTSGSLEDLKDAVLPRLENESDIPLFVQRRDEAIAIITASDRQVCVTNGTGGLQGCSNEPEAFMASFYEKVRSWNTIMFKSVSKPLITRCPFLEGPQDASLEAFFDDLLRTMIVEEDVEQAAEKYYGDNKVLDEEIATAGYAQHRDKEDITMCFQQRMTNW